MLARTTASIPLSIKLSREPEPLETETFIFLRASSDFIVATIKSELARRKINVSVSSGSGSRLSFMERGIEAVVRASIHYYNSEEELEHFLSKIRQLVA